MVTPVQKDSLTEYQIALATMLRITSAVSGVWTGKEIQPNPNRRSVMVPDIRVDDYIVDAEIGRIGADHYSGSEFTSEWKNGTPPIEWRRYSMSRHRSFGYVVFDEQARYSPIPNLHNEYVARKMSTTVLRDHDKYGLFAIISGHMTGKLVPRTGADAVGPYHTDAARIAHTGDARDYKWIAEPGEDYDNQIQPSFATIKGMYLDETDPLKTLDNLSIVFSDNWFDTNFQNSQRFVFVTSALELVFMNYLIEKGSGTESAFKLLKDGDISGAEAGRLPRHPQGFVEADQGPPRVAPEGLHGLEPRRRPRRRHGHREPDAPSGRRSGRVQQRCADVRALLRAPPAGRRHPVQGHRVRAGLLLRRLGYRPAVGGHRPAVHAVVHHLG